MQLTVVRRTFIIKERVLSDLLRKGYIFDYIYVSSFLSLSSKATATPMVGDDYHEINPGYLSGVCTCLRALTLTFKMKIVQIAQIALHCILVL